MPQLGGAWGVWLRDMHFPGCEGAEATFPGGLGAGPCAPAAWVQPERGVHDLVCRLAGTFRTPLRRELVAVRDTGKLPAFRRTEAGPRGGGDTSLPITEALGAGAPSPGFASELEETKTLVSAARAAGDPPRGCGRCLALSQGGRWMEPGRNLGRVEAGGWPAGPNTAAPCPGT